MNWRRIIAVIAGAAPAIASLADYAPPWVGMIGGIVAGAAINAEKIMAKRAKGAPTFDAAAAEGKTARLFPPSESGK
jgi:hypothetical protein